jgi:acyl carrier protein
MGQATGTIRRRERVAPEHIVAVQICCQRESLVTRFSRDQIFTELTAILREVFDDDTLVAEPAMSAADVEGWDSMGNVRLFLAVEQSFGVRFRAGEISDIPHLGALADAILAKA